MILALDIETKSITDDKEDALYPQKAEITCIGVYAPVFKKVYRAPWTEFINEVYNNNEHQFVGQNFKFDLKHMAHHFGPMPNWQERWLDDTRLMGFVSTTKIPQDYLDAYEVKRKELNDTLPQGINHRTGSLHSLKTMAPYFLNVDPFWENPADHNNDEYVLKDCEYTYKLVDYFTRNMTREEDYFYCSKLMPWTKMILEAELEGIVLDRRAISNLASDYKIEIAQLTANLKEVWHEHFGAYSKKLISELNLRYNEMFQLAASKRPGKSLVDLQLKYVNLFEKAKAKLIESGDAELSLDSPMQLKWLLTERLGLDVTNLEGDESTGKEVLQRLSKEDENVAKLLRLRKLTKLVTAFFPKYLDLSSRDGMIHAEYNMDGTRTGRLSSSRPNMQQHPRDLKYLFKARAGHKLITYDLQSIEPVLMAYYTEDESLVDIVINNKNFHSINTKLMFNLDCSDDEVKTLHKDLRDIAKEIGLAILYGAGFNQVKMSCMKRGIVKSDSECKSIVKMIREKYRGVWQFKQELDAEMEKGTVIHNLMGRPFKIEDSSDVYMKAFNTLIQGSASDLVLDIAHEIGQETLAKPIAFIHDSVVCQVDTTGADVEYEDVCIRNIFKRTLTTDNFKFTLNIEGGIADEWI